jgi:hypothetical protein
MGMLVRTVFTGRAYQRIRRGNVRVVKETWAQSIRVRPFNNEHGKRLPYKGGALSIVSS